MAEPAAGETPAVPPPPEAVAALRVHLALLAVQLIFGGFHVVGKAVLAEVTPLALACLRVLVATPLLLLVAWRRDRLVPGLRELPHLALLGLLGVFANQVLFIVGLNHTTATNAAILMPSIPVLTVAVGALLGVERIGPRRILAVCLAVTGALILLDPTRFSQATGTVLGNGLILLNCLSYSTFLVLQRPILQRLPWRTVIAWTFLFGTLGVLGVGGREFLTLQPGALSRPTWLGLGYIVLFPTTLSYALNTWAVRRSSPALVATYITLQPVATALLAMTFLGEELGWRELVGFGLIAAGLWRVSRR